MRKIILLLVALGVFTTSAYTQTTDDVLHELYQLSERYKVGIHAGYGLSVAGIILAPVGLGLFTIGSGYFSEDAQAQEAMNIAGYSIAGVGLVSLLIGIITWRDQEVKYIDVFERQARYKNFIRETEEKIQ